MERIALVLALVAGLPGLAAAQSSRPKQPLVHADVSGTIGWFNADRSRFNSYNDWYNRIAYGGLEAGWYWTEHLKTELDLGVTNRGHRYYGGPVTINGIPWYENGRAYFTARKLNVAAQYQFGHNAWFHPHVGAGLDLSWESETLERQPTYITDPNTRVVRLVRPADTRRNERLVPRPTVQAGFKAYMTPRSFFRTDFRMRASHGIDEALLRFGFGVDF